MANIEPKRKQYSIVLAGTFNPSQFHPEWFKGKDVISAEDAAFALDKDNPSPTIVTPQITQFRTSRLTVIVEQNRFQVDSRKEPLIAIKDFIGKTFEKLGGLTINAYGFNYGAHYQFSSEKALQAFADKLTPKQYWDALLGKNTEDEVRSDGLLSLRMLHIKENREGNISVLLQRSFLSDISPGIFLTCNDHTDVREEDSDAEIVIERIDSTFDVAFDNMANIQKDLIMEATKNE